MRRVLSHRPSLALLIALVALFLAVNGNGFAKVKPGPPPPPEKGVPSRAVMFFWRGRCPSGWSEFKAAHGRYIVGVPGRGRVLGMVGTALANLENRPTGEHTHTINDPGHIHDIGGHIHRLRVITSPNGSETAVAVTTGTGFWSNTVIEASPSGTLTTSAMTGITINAAGSVPGTNAPYVQLLACLKG